MLSITTILLEGKRDKYSLIPTSEEVEGTDVEGFFISRSGKSGPASLYFYSDPLIESGASVIYTLKNGIKITFGASRNARGYESSPGLVASLDLSYLTYPYTLNGEDLRPDLIDFLFRLNELLKETKDPDKLVIINAITELDPESVFL